MSLIQDKLIDEIKNQQLSYREFEPPYVVGEQLKEIGSESDDAASILYDDLQNEQMNLLSAANMLQSYSDKNRGSAKQFCITPKKADELLRDFYKLPQKANKSQSGGEGNVSAEPFVDLSAFL